MENNCFFRSATSAKRLAQMAEAVEVPQVETASDRTKRYNLYLSLNYTPFSVLSDLSVRDPNSFFFFLIILYFQEL